jgi:hypothetical protein
MALYVVTFTEQGGYRCQCRIRAAAGADHIALAVKKIWGATCYWSWVPGSDTDGRVYERQGEEPAVDDIPRTSVATVQLTPAQRRPRVS